MTFRDFLGRTRKKILHLFFGKSLYVNNESLYKFENYLIELKDTVQSLNQHLYHNNEKLISVIKKVTPKSYIDFLEIHLTEHCNLNCWGCSHFSSLANEEYLPLEVFKDDMKRLHELSSGNIGRINLMGGEPLLHPDLLDFFEVARSLFKNSIIRLVTNGILLKDMKESFWIAAKINNIYIAPTKYPINVPWDDIESIASQYEVKFNYFQNTDKYIKTMGCIALDIEGKQNQFNGFLFCHEGNNCIHLRKGRLYTCPIVAYAEHFNRFFDQNLAITDYDSIDIYQALNMQEILNFLARPIPFCRYCDVKRRSGENIWQISKKQISEWTGV